MFPDRPDESNVRLALTTAMICSGAVGAQFIGGKAVRDALYLANMDATTLPAIIVATSIVSIALVAISGRMIARMTPRTFVSALFVISAALLLAEWLLTFQMPKVAVVLVYIHISGLGPMLGSGFWLISSERFDPRTAKRRFGQIQGAGTFGGLLGGLIAERIAVLFGIAAMLPVLAALNLLCVWKIRQLAPTHTRGIVPSAVATDLAPEAPRSGLRVLAEAPYLRSLAALVLVGTISTTFIEYLFKVEAQGTFGRGEELLRFFAVYYAATSLAMFLIQTTLSRFALEQFGLAVAATAPSLALLAGSVGGLFAPGVKTLMAARAGESVLRGSVFRAGYELFFTPMAPRDKRAAKSIIDVGFDRLGDAVGGGAIRLVLLLVPGSSYTLILWLGMVCSTIAVIIGSRLNRGYIETLEKSLLHRALELDLSEAQDLTTQTVLIQTLRGTRPPNESFDDALSPAVSPQEVAALTTVDQELRQIVWLRSRERGQVLAVLRNEEGLTPALIPQAIALLASDPVANDAIRALRQVAEEHVGEFADHLIDPNENFVVRRRLARVFSVCVSQRAADGLMRGLDDLRFEVRFQCGRSLASIVDKNLMIKIDREQVFAIVLREVAVGRPVWESRRLLDHREGTDGSPFVDQFVRDRASQSLAHVFTLLSLVLPREPLQIAFRGLHTADSNLRGTALEYLEGVLPASIRDRLWPFLEDRRPGDRPPRPRDEILADLLRSNSSIMLNLEELKRAAKSGTDE